MFYLAGLVVRILFLVHYPARFLVNVHTCGRELGRSVWGEGELGKMLTILCLCVMPPNDITWSIDTK